MLVTFLKWDILDDVYGADKCDLWQMRFIFSVSFSNFVMCVVNFSSSTILLADILFQIVFLCFKGFFSVWVFYLIFCFYLINNLYLQFLF